MELKEQTFGVLSDGTEVKLYTISNGNMSFSCTEYGCTITSIVLNNKNGSKTDVLLGYSTLEGYLNSNYCFGTIVGRFANRIGNAEFTLNGVKYPLDKNDGPNTLHGGFNGYDKMLWTAEIVKKDNEAGVTFTRLSPDGEQGFPGNVKLSVTYLLDDKNNLSCIYNAESDKATPINMTNHAYFNLAGNGPTDTHTLVMDSKYRLEVDKRLIPTGKILDVTGTPFDFTTEKTIGRDIKKVGVGYDHCYVTTAYNPDDLKAGFPTNDDKLVTFCTVKDPASGHEMSVKTNMVGCQLYTGNFIKGIRGKNGRIYENHDAYCLETQSFPDAPNKENFPSCILEPGKVMKAKTIYTFKN